MTAAAPGKSPAGFVGVGNMGRRMAANLAAAGFPLVIRDSDAETQRRFIAEHGGEPGDSPQAFAGATVVVTMLPDGNAVREAVLGWESGIASALSPGSVILDMSSADPVGTQKLAADLAPARIRVVDAPVSGGIARAETGTLSLMVGGQDEDAFAVVRPVLEVLGERIFRTGPLGSGHAMKAINNYVSAAGLVAAAEGVLAAQRFGLDPGNVVDILNASTGMNNSTLNKFHQFILSRTFDSGFSLELMVKDLKTALEVARSTGSPAPLAEACLEAWTEAQAALGPGLDHTAVVRHWEKLAGSELGKKQE